MPHLMEVMGPGSSGFAFWNSKFPLEDGVGICPAGGCGDGLHIKCIVGAQIHSLFKRQARTQKNRTILRNLPSFEADRPPGK